MPNVIQFRDVEQNTDEWMELRRGKVTASNFGLIMANEGKAFGDPAKKYALTLALEICTGEKTNHGFSNSHMERGSNEEPFARQLYEELTYSTVKSGGFFCTDRYGDSPDGLVNDDGVIEIKSVIPTVHYSTLCRNNYDPSYHWQIIGHLDATKRDWCDFISYCSDFTESKKLLIYRIYRNDCLEDINKLIERRNKFIELIDDIVQKIKD